MNLHLLSYSLPPRRSRPQPDKCFSHVPVTIRARMRSKLKQMSLVLTKNL